MGIGMRRLFGDNFSFHWLQKQQTRLYLRLFGAPAIGCSVSSPSGCYDFKVQLLTPSCLCKFGGELC